MCVFEKKNKWKENEERERQREREGAKVREKEANIDRQANDINLISWEYISLW